ncbi:peptidoglycan recognition protein family protein [Geopsychrobacter electrodiphilus]|uniref:peptidoglycan recognition protein family protein n=1 Tax=Geopsychrobacter electrodiphilus TaxID=225196 RepID=UPI0003805790|nr:peptidoglycan recognition family protein [Geopsychrobacter electrodiphilus]
MDKFKKPPIGICIHHSATTDGSHLDADAIRRYHIQTNGWDDIGYHALVERVNGQIRVVPGRSIEMQGAHCPALNASYLGLCIVGNFDLTTPDNDLLDVAAAWCRQQMEHYKMDLRRIVYHCDYSSKTCPGMNFPKGGFLLQLAGEERPGL